MQHEIIANRYKIYEQLDETSLSIDYKASDEKRNLPVIIRLFKQENRPLELQLRFKKEIGQISELEHPTLVKIYDVGEYEGSNFVAIEDCDAPALSHYLTKPIAVDTSVDIILQIATGLELIHQKGIIHLAVNPSGIIALYSNDRITVKLSNFGVGLLLDLANVKSEEEIITAFGYMSPEATGILRKPIDARSDIYSLGIIFFQFLTGVLPF